MAQANDAPTTLPPVRVSRTLRASPERVFRAWSSAEHVARWFAPRPFTIPEARVEMRVGGAFELLFRSPEGQEHRIRGAFTEVQPNRRLVIDITVEDAAGKPQFRAVTEVELSQAADGTRLDVTQTYTVLDPKDAWMVEGAPQGWSAALAQLEEVVLDLGGSGIPPVTISRAFQAPVEAVFRAWTTGEHVKRWFCPEGTSISEATVDPRVGGVFEYCIRFATGAGQWCRGVFVELTPNARLVTDLQVFAPDGRPLFRALTEVTFSKTVGGTRLDIVQRYREVDPDIAGAIAEGGPEGWGSTLEKLDTELLRMAGGGDATERSAARRGDAQDAESP